MSEKIEKLCVKETSKQIAARIFKIVSHSVKGVETYNEIVDLVCQLGLTAQEEGLKMGRKEAPDCDNCDRIDPDNPPERYNEGYE